MLMCPALDGGTGAEGIVERRGRAEGPGAAHVRGGGTARARRRAPALPRLAGE
ncbi:hypothetical protein AB5I41_25165 [Sphingomonas sp. MMS24-JH45]